MPSSHAVVKKPILLSELSRLDVIDKLIIESIEQTLYRVEIEVGGDVFYLLEKPGKGFTRRSVLQIQERLIPFNIKKMYLRHQSPYDEMIGHSVNQNSNMMQVPLGYFFEKIENTSRH